ncbi:ethylene-responsive transcription factor ERF017-like [Bidens hawaiensis]|uniref:ethylene-responsive transcription factor ERF017-like n=1 Tax=Bidens hawaiensis TaxID=980011 RepID=UPI004049B23C
MKKNPRSVTEKKAATGGGEGSKRNPSDDAKYRGVRKRKWGKWVSEIRLPNSRERIWLGSYDSPEKAARAFDAALFCLRGNNANFNFPHQPPNIPGGTDLHPSEIQAAAARFANSYIPSSSSSHELHDQDPEVSDNQHASTSMDVVSSPSSFLMDAGDHVNHIPDYGIFPGFDDYFMPLQPPFTVDYGEEVYDQGVYSEDPSFLWSF